MMTKHKPGHLIPRMLKNHWMLFYFLIVFVSCNAPEPISLQSSDDSVSYQENKSSEWFLATGNWQNDPKLFVTTRGSGKDTVIMLHGGWGGEHRGLISATKGLEDDFFFVFYDQRGSLRSPFADSLISFNHHIDDLELLRKELGLNKIKIAGHSMGAVLASAYHHKYPEHVKSLILLAPAHLKNPFPQEDNSLKDEHDVKLQAFLQRPEIGKELSRLKLDRQSPPLSSQEATHKFRITIGARFIFDIRNWTKLKGGGPFYNPKIGYLTSQTLPAEGWDYPMDFKQSGIPISVIVGDHDFLDMQGNFITKWTEGLANVEVSIINKAGHSIWLDQPSLFLEKFQNALRK